LYVSDGWVGVMSQRWLGGVMSQRWLGGVRSGWLAPTDDNMLTIRKKWQTSDVELLPTVDPHKYNLITQL
jgi:hypothetical protein